ncbi:hypothetical protein [Methanolacinia paynteri]|uniref:hypothetical protein n=1 Tax=Methanolacinia paynteri TaxID=230356 RepID=UPI0012F7052E|nr:hypothetical protein [Methanolacinia paynteri]
MSKAVKIDENGDTLIDTAGRIKSVSGHEKIIQDLTVLLRSVKGSLPFDTTFGIEDFPEMNNPSSKIMGNAVYAAILQHPEVSDIRDLQVSKEGRMMYVSLTVLLNDGADVDMEMLV